MATKSPEYMRPRQQEEFRPAASITAKNIEKAAGVFPCSERATRYNRRRIEAWGRSNREFLRSLGARFVKRAA